MNTNKHILIAFFALSIGLIACQPEASNSVSISGTMENGAGKTLYFQKYDNSGSADSTVINADNSFTMVTDNMSKDFYKMYFDKTGLVLLIMDSTHTGIQVTADADRLPGTTKISGSKDSELMLSFFERSESFGTRMDSLNKLVRSMGSDMDQTIRQGLNSQIVMEQRAFEKEMADLALENSKSPAALSIVSMLNPVNNVEVMKKVYSDLQTVIPGSKFLDGLNQQIAKASASNQQTAAPQKVNIGQMAPELDLNDVNGNSVKLSSLRGQYVLIDFWASWCGPCRRENPNVKKMYSKYSKEKFEIYGVSLDNNADRWKAAIVQDDIPWVHVSDLAKWNSIAAKAYGVKSIPYTALLDPEGNVIGTKLRGIGLENKLKEIFGY